MANRIKGITIEIDGNTTPLSNALKSVNKTISQTQSELRDVNKLLKLDPNNVQLLNQKQELLVSALNATTQKLNEEKKALEQLKQSGNTEENQEQQRALEREIIATEQSLEKLVAESKKTDDALNNTGKAAKDSGEKAKKGSKGFTTLKAVIAHLTADAIKAAGRGLKALGKASVNAVKDAAEAGDEIDKMSQKLGLSRKGYQEWDYVLAQAGVDINSLQTGMKTMTNKIDAAKKGTSSAVDTFSKLGISMKDLEGMSREDAFSSIVKQLQGMEDSTERAALANQLFGRSGQNLIPLFNSSAEATQKLKDEANNLGAVMGDDAVNAGVKFQDQIAGLKATFDAVKNGVMSTLLPSLTTALGGLQKLIAGNKEGADELKKGIQNMVAEISNVFDKFKEILEPIISSVIAVLPDIIMAITQALISLLPSVIDAVVAIIPPLLTALLNMLPQLIGVITSIATSLLSNISTMLPQIVTAIIDIVPQIVNELVKAIPKLLEGAIMFLTAIVDAIPQIITSITAALPLIVETIVKFLSNPNMVIKVLSATLKLLGAILKAIPQIIVSLTKLLPNIITAIVNGLGAGLSRVGTAAHNLAEKIKEKITEIKDKALTWGADLVTNFVNGIKNSLYKITDAMKVIGKKIKDLIGFSEPKTGPLSNFHTFAPDMVDLFVKGINDSLPKLQNAVTGMAATVDGGITNNKNVTVNQYNTYSSPHSQYELWKSRQDLTRTINNTVRGAI